MGKVISVPRQTRPCSHLSQAIKNASSFHGDAKRFYTIGESAGGGLAFQIANKVKRDPELKDSLKGIVALVPLTVHYDHVPAKYKSMYKAFTENATDVPILDKNSVDIFYRELGVDPKDPEVFILLAEDIHKDFPPTYLVSCEYDPLRDDAYAMEMALMEAKVPTKHDHYKGLPHVFWTIPSLPEGKQFVGNLLAGIGWLQSQM